MNIEQLLAETPEQRERRNKRIDSRLLTKRTKPKNVINVVITPAKTLGERMDAERAYRIRSWRVKAMKNGYKVKGY